MTKLEHKLTTIDPVWSKIQDDAREMVTNEPLMASVAHVSILNHNSLDQALAFRLSSKIKSMEISEELLVRVFSDAYLAQPEILQSARADFIAFYERDPACNKFLQPFLYYKGFQAVQSYRVAHWLWNNDRKDLAYFIQNRCSEVYSIDIHPAAVIGKGLMVDHGHSIVIGETAVVGDNVSMLHSVTLGGTGKNEKDRHPKVGDGVLIGAGAKVLGNIKIGHCSRIAAGSVVLKEVPPCKTVAGVPAKIVGEAGCDQPSLTMDQLIKENK
mgnify:FL=1